MDEFRLLADIGFILQRCNAAASHQFGIGVVTILPGHLSLEAPASSGRLAIRPLAAAPFIRPLAAAPFIRTHGGGTVWQRGFSDTISPKKRKSKTTTCHEAMLAHVET